MKKYIFGGIVLVVAGLLLGMSLSVKAPAADLPPANYGAVNDNSGYSFNTPICHAGSGTSVCEDWAGGKIEAKSNQASWLNTTGMTQYVDIVEVSTVGGNASSTFNVWAVATSSALSTGYDFTSPLATSTTLINNFTIPTTSPATTTSSLEKSFVGRVVAVPDSSRVDFYLRSSSGGICNPQAFPCETATSSNRGFNLIWRLHYHN